MPDVRRRGLTMCAGSRVRAGIDYQPPGQPEETDPKWLADKSPDGWEGLPALSARSRAGLRTTAGTDGLSGLTAPALVCLGSLRRVRSVTDKRPRRELLGHSSHVIAATSARRHQSHVRPGANTDLPLFADSRAPSSTTASRAASTSWSSITGRNSLPRRSLLRPGRPAASSRGSRVPEWAHPALTRYKAAGTCGRPI